MNSVRELLYKGMSRTVSILARNKACWKLGKLSCTLIKSYEHGKQGKCYLLDCLKDYALFRDN